MSNVREQSNDATRTGSMQAIEQRLNAICEAQPFTTSWYVKDLTTGDHADRAGHVPVPSASTRKISIMMAALRSVHAGRLDLAEKVVIEERLMRDVASGTFQHMTPGLVIPLRDAIVQMIITSDNVCTGLVVERLSIDALNEFCRSVGMTGTVHRFAVPPANMPANHALGEVTTTTPADQGRLLELILDGTKGAPAARLLGCTPELCRLALDILSWQKFNTMIPSLLPDMTKVAHKTGTGRRGRMDAGIVYRGEDPSFIIAAYTDQVPQTLANGLPGFTAAFAVIGQLTRACWDMMGR